MICLVHLCSGRSDRPGRYSLFPFPTNLPDIIRQWYSFCSIRHDQALPRTAAICARHFHPSDLVAMGESR